MMGSLREYTKERPCEHKARNTWDKWWANKNNRMSIVLFKSLCENIIFSTPNFKPRDIKYLVPDLVVGPGKVIILY